MHECVDQSCLLVLKRSVFLLQQHLEQFHLYNCTILQEQFVVDDLDPNQIKMNGIIIDQDFPIVFILLHKYFHQLLSTHPILVHYVMEFSHNRSLSSNYASNLLFQCNRNKEKEKS